MPFYFPASVLLFLFQVFITLTTKINIFPELVYYPWIMSKGLLIYRDFTIQHGYFMQLLLIPFTFDKSLFMMKGFFVAIQLINLFLVLKILKKTTSKIGFIFGGGLFIVLNYYLVDSNLWDETILTSFYLFIYQLLLGNKDKKKLLLIGLLLGAVSFMKPSFGVMIIPVLFFSRSLIPLIPLVGIWVVSSFVFLVNNSFGVFIDNYILFNKFYALVPRIWTIDTIFVIRTLVFLSVSFILYCIYRKKFTNNPIILFTLFSLLLFFPSYNKINLVPFGAFFCILVGQLLGRAKKLVLFLFIILFASYGIFISRQAKHLYMYLKTYRQPFMETKQTRRIVDRTRTVMKTSDRIYILGNNVELYYFLDRLSPVWYSIIWPIDIRYNPHVEKRTINEIMKSHVSLVVMPKPLNEDFKKLTRLMLFIKDSYTPVYEDGEVLILKRR